MKNELVPVLSFDPNKTRMIDFEGQKAVSKKTTIKEHQQMQIAHQYLNHFRLDLKDYGDWKINTAPIVCWSKEKSILITRFCGGTNGETSLRNFFLQKDNSRAELIQFIRQLILAIRYNGFLWGDFAPRNMILDFESKQIWLVDFERHLQLRYASANELEFSRYLRGYAREEFSSLLTSAEQRHFFADLLIAEKQPLGQKVSEIRSKRKISLLQTIFGQENFYTGSQIKHAEDLMTFAATPFRIGKSLFYPMDIIDKFSNKKGAQEYAKLIHHLHGRNQWQRYLSLRIHEEQNY